jgi:PST family polysaccharide transporter
MSATSSFSTSPPAPTQENTLTDAALDATRWNYAGFVSRGAAALVVGTILARLLGPKPFGQVAVATIVFGLANLIADAGFSSALIQIPELSERQIRVAFTMQILVGFLMTSLVWLIAPAVSAAFRDPGALDVIRAVSPLFVLQSLGQTSTGLMKRHMRFRSLQMAQVLSYLIGYAGVGIVMAYTGYGVWSLVTAQLFQALLYSLMAYTNVRHPLRPYLDRAGFRVLRFGVQVTSANILNWSIFNLDNILVGRRFGSTYLGLYSRSFNLAITPVEGFVTACQQVLFTSCSKVEQQFDRMSRAYLAAAAGVSLVTMPVFWSLSTSSQIVIGALFGPRWNEAVPLFAAFAVAMPFFALMAIAGPILGAADRVNLEIRTQAISLGFTAAVFFIASRTSLLAVAWAVPLVYAFRFWFITQPTLRLLGLRWCDLFTAMAGPAFVASVTTACVFCASRIIGVTVKPGIALVGLAAFGLIAAAVAAYLCGSRLLPSVLANPLRARVENAPSWMVYFLRPFLYSSFLL